MPPAPREHTPGLCQDLLDHAPDPLVAIDATGRVVTANARAQTLLGAAPGDLTGVRGEDLLPGVFASVTAPDSPWTRGQVTRLQATARGLDGAVIPVEVSVSPAPTRAGVLAIASIRDLSERFAVERASERVRDELIANVSHELRTPLTSIMGYTEILVDLGAPVVGAEAMRLLGIVRRNAERELGVVEDLLTLAVLGASGLHVEPVPTDLGPLVRGVLAELGSFAAEAGVSLVPDGVRSLHVIGDPDRLTEVISSLVTGAVKFSRAGDCVEVRLATDGDHGLLEVVDRGSAAVEGGAVPLSTGERPRLPVVRGIVEAHAGRLGVAHEPGRGTTVQVRLPLTRG